MTVYTVKDGEIQEFKDKETNRKIYRKSTDKEKIGIASVISVFAIWCGLMIYLFGWA